MLLRDERFPAVTEIAVEGFAKITDKTAGDERAGDMGPADRAGRRLMKHRLDRDRDAERVEPFDDSNCAVQAHLAQAAETVFQFREFTEMQAQEVCLGVVFHRAQLDTGNQSDAHLRAHSARIREASDRVMIREGERGEPGGMRGVRDIGRRPRTVRRGRMCVKVDELVLRSGLGGIAHDV